MDTSMRTDPGGTHAIRSDVSSGPRAVWHRATAVVGHLTSCFHPTQLRPVEPCRSTRRIGFDAARRHLRVLCASRGAGAPS
eukprot:5887602-Prymnesium_polylepis.2